MFSFPVDFRWLPPWIELQDDYVQMIPISWPDDIQLSVGRNAVVEELRREMPETHALFEQKLEAVAVNVECGYKDYVFSTDNPQFPIVVVHLTYSVEIDPAWQYPICCTTLSERVLV